MILEKAIWTTLPAQFTEDGRLLVSVHIAPRLTTDDGDTSQRKLGEFPAFAKWPDRLANMRYTVEFDSGLTADGIPLSKANPELWRRLFVADTLVQPHAFQDHARRNLHVFPVRQVLEFVRQTYGSLAGGGPDLPSIDDAFGPLAAFSPLEGLTNRIAHSRSFWEEFYRGHKKEGRSDGRVVAEDIADGQLSPSQQEHQNSLFQAYRFYYRPGSQRPDFPERYVEPPPDVPRFDFHEIVSLLADHPVLLRQVGLVVDLVVDLKKPVDRLPATGVVRVVPEGELPEHPPTCPGTRYDLDANWFGARPQQKIRMERGLLGLTPKNWDLFQIDVDGAALQAVGFGDTLGRLRDPDRRNQETPAEAGAPALRSAGLALALHRRGEALLESLRDRRGKNDSIEDGIGVVFDAEDLVRGYRVDVFDADAPSGACWFSLHDRIAHHTVHEPDGGGKLELGPIRDEGYIKSTAASSERKDHPNASDDLYLHETVVAWDGWSLSAPRPGKRIVEPGEGDNGSDSHLARYQPEVGRVLPILSTVSVAPGTLPRLRIGHTYRMRVRTVDLAGNSRPFRDKDIELNASYLASEAQAYMRFEPVPSPTVLRRHLDTEGESLEHLVIRSNLGVTAADYAASAEVTVALQQAGVTHTYAEDSQRHLAPPKGSEQMAEQDGRFESAFGGSPAQATAALRLSLREEGTFLDPLIIDPAKGQKTIPQSMISLFPAGTSLPKDRGGGLPRGAYAFFPNAEVVLPYLPDPLAIGVSLTGYDYTGTEVFHQWARFPGAWPTLAPFRIRLAEGPLGLEFVGGVLDARLPKAEVIRCRLASVFPKDRLEDFAIWQWTPEAARNDDLVKAIAEGRHWMFTPYRWLILTHAVQQPLAAPDMRKALPKRELGSTYAEFHGAILAHAASTGRLDVFGEWTEDVDLLTDDEPRMTKFKTAVQHTARAFGFDITPDEDNAKPTKGVRVSRHEFGDTKYRRILYHSVATTRFRDLLPRPIADDASRIQRIEPARDAANNERPQLVRHIPSSARPAAPQVLYVLPTFRWERQDEGPVRTHVRRGRAVRVWLRRPWFSSGDGEQLGVVLEPGIRLPRGWSHGRSVVELSAAKLAGGAPFVSEEPLRPLSQSLRQQRRLAMSPGAAALGAGRGGGIHGLRIPPDAAEIRRMLLPYITQWGSDPVWTSQLPNLPPTVAAFPHHVSYATGLTLEEVAPEALVVVASHQVFYDRGRRLWYCDIEIDTGDSYYPFVRLALARYQPHSLPGAHLSRVTMTDFIQLAPDRTAEVLIGRTEATVTVRGFSGRNIVGDPTNSPFVTYVLSSADLVAPNTLIRVALQRRAPGIPGDMGWEQIGNEMTLHARSLGFNVIWTGSIPLTDEAIERGDHRLLITEVETFPRDRALEEPGLPTNSHDFVRERVVYADTFEM